MTKIKFCFTALDANFLKNLKGKCIFMSELFLSGSVERVILPRVRENEMKGEGSVHLTLSISKAADLN